MMQTQTTTNLRYIPIPDRWCLHSYYSLCPYAPDRSGRLLLAGADLEANRAEVIILGSDGQVLDRWGSIRPSPSFWHTGLWQSWSPDAQKVYYQSGTLEKPQTTRRDLTTGEEIVVNCDLEGISPSGEPALSCLHGMLYAAGYGGNGFQPEISPVPFQERQRHGISQIDFDSQTNQLLLSTEAILQRHPLYEQIKHADRQIKARLGQSDGLTLMTYCVRWNSSGSRCLFFFGNHCVVKSRGEPKITSIFTADKDLKEIHLAVDFSFDRFGLHWAWQADNEHLIGYGPDPENPSHLCLAEVRYDGTGYRKLSDHASGGHPSTSPSHPDLIVTDESSASGGNVVFISKRSGQIIESVALPKFLGECEYGGRDATRVCHHPVFNQSGDRVLCNSMPGKLATMVELPSPTL